MGLFAICGHVHFPSVSEVDGIVYCNDGEWVENCTALVQDFDGNLSLVSHKLEFAALLEAGA